MNYRLKILRLHMPEYIKNKKLDNLFRLTAEAFQCENPDRRELSFADRLTIYAAFTKEQAEAYLQKANSSEAGESEIIEVEDKLYRDSFHLGQEIRKNLRVRTWEDAVQALELIYRIIGVDFKCCNCRFTVCECYYSNIYTEDVCRLISNIDAGLAAGLSGGGELTFTRRITEGNSSCEGCFSKRTIARNYHRIEEN